MFTQSIVKSAPRGWIGKCYRLQRALKLYIALLSTSTSNCFAPMFKRKLDKCTMNCDDRLRHFNKTLTNQHWMSCAQNSCIHGKCHVQTIKCEPWFLSKKLRTCLFSLHHRRGKAGSPRNYMRNEWRWRRRVEPNAEMSYRNVQENWGLQFE